MSVILTAVLGVITWLCWGFYQEEVLQSRFMKEGKPISVTVDQAERERRSWRDILGNSVYLHFTYQGKPYTTRYVMTDTYVSSGDQVQLLYHPTIDAFRQPGRVVVFNQYAGKSRLVNWTTVRDFSNENKLLVLCIILATAFLFMASGIIVSILPIPFLRSSVQLILIVELVAVAIFFTYDTWKYHQYYQSMKAQGHPEMVKVISTHRHSYHRSSRHRHWSEWYDYYAYISFKGQQRTIAISEEDYESLKPNDPLKALYDPSVDDLMSADYSFEFKKIAVPVFFWLIALVVLRAGFSSWRSTYQTAPQNRVL
ncbi:hypothetical protein [Spirosoma harenae]